MMHNDDWYGVAKAAIEMLREIDQHLNDAYKQLEANPPQEQLATIAYASLVKISDLMDKHFGGISAEIPR